MPKSAVDYAKWTELLERAVEPYTAFSVRGRPVVLPYAMSEGRWRFWKTSGKGSPREIEQELLVRSQKEGVVIALMNDDQLRKFVRASAIGIDCSGFAVHVLDPLVRLVTGQSLASTLLRFPGFGGRCERLIRWKRVRRLSAATLTNDLNSFSIPLSEVRPGDLIRLSPPDWKGGHVLVVLSRGAHELRYAHSSKTTLQQGPHRGVIHITDWDTSLTLQEWEEVTKDKKPYNTVAFHEEKGDGIRRLRCLHSV